MIDSELLPLADSHRTLRPLKTVDAQPYAEGTRDPLVQRYGHLPEPEYTPELVARLAQTVVPAGLDRGDLALLSIVDADDAFLGSLVLFDVTSGSGEVGFWIRPDARGGGHARGALHLGLRLAADSGLEELTARTETDNVASQRNLEGAGFQLVDRSVGRTPAQVEVGLLSYRRPISPLTPAGEQWA